MPTQGLLFCENKVIEEQLLINQNIVNESDMDCSNTCDRQSTYQYKMKYFAYLID